jgi:RNA polymerase sigma factor (sigma-70 family)
MAAMTVEEAPDGVEGGFALVEAAFRKLSAPQRAMVALHLVDGLTVKECAAVLGCRSGTARSHLGRAVAKLRKELTNA